MRCKCGQPIRKVGGMWIHECIAEPEQTEAKGDLATMERYATQADTRQDSALDELMKATVRTVIRLAEKVGI